MQLAQTNKDATTPADFATNPRIKIRVLLDVWYRGTQYMAGAFIPKSETEDYDSNLMEMITNGQAEWAEDTSV